MIYLHVYMYISMYIKRDVLVHSTSQGSDYMYTYMHGVKDVYAASFVTYIIQRKCLPVALTSFNHIISYNTIQIQYQINSHPPLNSSRIIFPHPKLSDLSSLKTSLTMHLGRLPICESSCPQYLPFLLVPSLLLHRLLIKYSR